MVDAVNASPVTEIAKSIASGRKSTDNDSSASAPSSRSRRHSAREIPASTSTAEKSSPWKSSQETTVRTSKLAHRESEEPRDIDHLILRTPR